jgi:hypothetical protein
MCTVSFIPIKDRICITSNRDEHSVAVKLIPPSRSIKLGMQILFFPKDSKAGGTWIALRGNGDAARVTEWGL